MYIFYLLFSKIGIVFPGSGKSRLNSALSAFTKAQEELRIAIDCELRSVQKTDESLKKAREEFKRKEEKLTKQSEDHLVIRNQSLAYLNKIENFLNVESNTEFSIASDETPQGGSNNNSDS